jgi:SNF2 family DNA or RNA helicase
MYTPKHKPFQHQAELFEKTKDLKSFAFFWEQGTGKSKEIIDTAGYLFTTDKIDALFVVAPNGVHRNWVVNECPTHLPDSVLKQTYMHFYQGQKAHTKGHKTALQQVLKHKGFAVLTMSYNSFMTEAGKKVAKDFLSKRSALYVLDESSAIKNPTAKRTKTILASSSYGAYRRVLDGTPVSNSPFDIYTQLQFLEKDFWVNHKFSSFTVFKHHFGIWKNGFNSQSGRDFEFVVGYHHLPELHEIVDTISSRVLKEDVLDLPPKLYQKRYFDMNPAQQKAYAELRDEAITFLSGLNEEDLEGLPDEDAVELFEQSMSNVVEAPLAIVRLLRLQQVTSGYVPNTEGEFWEFEGVNARLATLAEVCEQTVGKGIIWAKFTRDIDLIMKLLGDTAVRYDGQVTDEERGESIEKFQSGTAKWFVANPAVGATGLTLTAATTVVFYNNTFKLSQRLQAEDRAHRIGQEHPVNYVDIIAAETIDEKIVQALVNKMNIASQVTGDVLKEWL